MRLLVTQRHLVNGLSDADQLETDYYRLFYQLKPAATLIPITNNEEINHQKMIDELAIDGVVLSGGNDLVYSDKLVNRPSSFSPERNHLERNLLEYALRLDLPVLGICRGLQLISQFFGGEIRLAPSTNHYHQINVVADSLIEEFGRDQQVNSYHDFVVPEESASEAMRVLAIEPEGGHIEALGIRGHKITAVQWHPEREELVSRLDQRLIGAFLSGFRW